MAARATTGHLPVETISPPQIPRPFSLLDISLLKGWLLVSTSQAEALTCLPLVYRLLLAWLYLLASHCQTVEAGLRVRWPFSQHRNFLGFCATLKRSSWYTARINGKRGIRRRCITAAAGTAGPTLALPIQGQLASAYHPFPLLKGKNMLCCMMRPRGKLW